MLLYANTNVISIRTANPAKGSREPLNLEIRLATCKKILYEGSLRFFSQTNEVWGECCTELKLPPAFDTLTLIPAISPSTDDTGRLGRALDRPNHAQKETRPISTKAFLNLLLNPVGFSFRRNNK